jgi:hypothetical protein
LRLARVKERRDSLGEPRVSVAAHEESRKDISFSFLLRSVFPQLLPHDVRFPKEVVDLRDRLWEERNSPIHNPTRFGSDKASEMRQMLRFVGGLRDFLFREHAQPPSVDTTFRPRDPGTAQQ